MAKVGVVGIIPRGKTVLVLRRSRADEFLPGSYDLPGGGLDPGESPEAGIKREVSEETGLRVSVVKGLGTRSYVLSDSGRKDKLLVTFLLKAEDDKSEITLSEEHDEYHWVSSSDLDDVFGPQNLMKEIVREYFKTVG